MKFRYAAELKRDFEVHGHFYNLQVGEAILKCRSVLEIRKSRQRTKPDLPDAVFMMMNPGSSKPKDHDYIPKLYTTIEYNRIETKELVPTQPDSTQYQVMRLMKLMKWSFVRILNLSDLRNGNSVEFQKQLRVIAGLDDSNPDSLLSKHRSDELSRELLSNDDLIIGAWGSIPELGGLAEEFLQLYPNTVMLLHGKFPYCRHASPMMKTHKIDWLKSMKKLIRSQLC